MNRILVILLSALMISSCLPGDMQVPQNSLLPMLERKSGRIAFIGADLNIYTADQAGNNLVAHTSDAKIPADEASPYRYYILPAWSHDSASLGFVGVSGQGTEISSSVYIANVDEETSEQVFQSTSEQPFYLYWSPDNNHLSFLSSTVGGGSLILQSVSSGQEDRTILDTGSPYYWSWAPDGRTMIVHTGSSQSILPDHLAFLQVDSEVVEYGLDTLPATFQSPAWSPDGSRILMTRLSEQDKQEIVLTDAHGEIEKVIAAYDLNAAFAWSNNSDRVAYIEGKQTLNTGTLGTLHVIDLETSEQLFEAEDVYAFFWSPDDREIAYLTPSVGSASSGSQQEDSTTQEQQLFLHLQVVDVDSGESREIFVFRPTNQFADILSCTPHLKEDQTKFGILPSQSCKDCFISD